MDFAVSAMVVSAIALFSFIVGSLVWMSDHKTIATKLFLAIIIVANFWTVFSIFSFSTQLSPFAAQSISNAAAGSSFALVAVCYLFSEAFVQRRLSRFTTFVGIPAAVCLTVLFSTNYNCGTLDAAQNCSGGTLYNAMIICIGVLFLAIVFNCLRGITSKSKEIARQSRLIAYGLLGGIAYGVFFGYVLPTMGIKSFNHYYSLATVIFVSFTFYAIVRHQLFNVRMVIARSLAYVGSLAAMAALYGFVIFGLAGWLFNLEFSLSVQVYASITTALAAVSFGRLKRFFDKVTDKLFYRDNYDTQQLLDTLNKLFVANVDLEHMLGRSAKVIQDTFRAEFCFFGIKEDTQTDRRIIGTSPVRIDDKVIEYVKHMTPHIRHKIIVTELLGDNHQKLQGVLQDYSVAVLSRLTTSVGVEGMGYMVLGARRSGNTYTAKDIKTLEIVVNELVIAIQNSLHFEEIQHFNETLQEKVDAATKKLRQNNDKLRALDNTTDEFISMASHQLRTPLTSVKGYLSMVLDGDTGKITEEQRKLLNQAYVSSQRMVYTIADLLNVSRLQTGKFEIERSPVTIANIVSEEIVPLQESAKLKNITLSYTAPQFCPPLMLDEMKTRQVIMNFIDNAIYYTPSGGTIEIKVQTSGKMLELLVIDSGMGVPKKDQPHLFTKFYRASNAQRARPDGTGLGLFMAKKIIVAEGGSLIFKSTEAKGSTFGFSFPLVKE